MRTTLSGQGVQIIGLRSLIWKLQARLAKIQPYNHVSAIVAYDPYYSVYVHENLLVHHPVGQAKFLEEPARTKIKEIQRAATFVMRRGGTFGQALVAAGRVLLQFSNALTPVDTGDLKRSGHVRLEKGRP